MAGNVVNLNRFRKKKEREERARQAEINRIRHGRTKAQKEREIADRERAARLLEGKRLETSDEGSAAAPEESPVAELADARDGLTRKERAVLVLLGRLQAERGDRNVPLPQLYGSVIEVCDMSIDELQQIVERLGAGTRG
jgi:hypothetical protein